MIVSLENDLLNAAVLQSGRTYSLPMSETQYMRLAVDLADVPEESEIQFVSDESVLTATYYSHYGTKDYYKIATISEGTTDLKLMIISEGSVVHQETLTFQVNA